MAKDIPVVYLVDEAGLRSSVDHFVHIKKECALDVFNKYASQFRSSKRLSFFLKYFD